MRETPQIIKHVHLACLQWKITMEMWNSVSVVSLRYSYGFYLNYLFFKLNVYIYLFLNLVKVSVILLFCHVY